MFVVSKLFWQDVNNDVKRVNKELYDIVEQISPDKNFPIYKVRYPYGQYVTECGTLLLPDEQQQFHRIDSGRFDQDFVRQFTSGPTPLILQLHNVSEAFLDTGQRIIPINVFKPGDLYGLFEAIMGMTDCPISPTWHVSSGSRSTFMLPRISDKTFHKRLCNEFNIHVGAPSNFYEQWNVFKAIHNSSQNRDDWYTEVLVFPDVWLSEKNDGKAWLQFQKYLLAASWRQADFIRKKYELNMLWESFSPAIRNLKPNIYILDTLKHLILLACGSVPGFKASLGNNECMPATTIEKAYVDVYRLADYYPHLMTPHRFGHDDDYSALYYSLSYPTLVEGSPLVRKMRSLAGELFEIKKLLESFNDILKNKLRTFESKNLDLSNMDFFHPTRMVETLDVLNDDKNLNVIDHPDYPERCFSNKNYFFRGCIRISKKN